MTHFSADEFIDAVDGTLPQERRDHLRTCTRCRDELAQISAVLRDLDGVGVPEPSPLFWDQFSARLRRSIDAEPARAARWFDWPVLAPVAGVAALVLALVGLVPQGASELRRVQLAMSESAAPTDLDALDEDDRWTMLFELVGDLDVQTAAEAGIVGRPGAADRAVLHLTSAEQQELVRLLREELRSGG